eukprot:scaffold1912_cov135-Cylindrotheca_fusiformis.AAC.14
MDSPPVLFQKIQTTDNSVTDISNGVESPVGCLVEEKSCRRSGPTLQRYVRMHARSLPKNSRH